MNAIRDWFKNNPPTKEKILFFILICGFFGMPLGTAPPNICGAAAAAIWIFSGLAFHTFPPMIRQKWTWPVLFLSLLPWIGLLYSPDVQGLGMDYAGKTHYWLYGFALAAIACRVDSELFIKAFLAGMAFNAVVGTMQLTGLYPPKNGWYCGLGRGYSTLSAYLVLGMLMVSFYFRRAGEFKHRFLLGALIAFYFFHLVILQGRTGYVTFAILTPVLVRNLFSKTHPVTLVVMCLVVLGLMGLSPVVQDRVKLSVDQINYHLNADPSEAWGKKYSNQQDRFYMWYGGVHIFLDNPLTGVGTGGYQTALKARGEPGDPAIAHPHNDLLYMAVSFGIVGIAAFFWLFGEIFRNCRPRRAGPVGYFVFSTALVILVSGLLNAQILDAGMIYLLSMAVGMQAVLVKPGDENNISCPGQSQSKHTH